MKLPGRHNRPNYIIFSPPYDENSGGVIVLHKLCDRLNALGQSAYLWPSDNKHSHKLSHRLKSRWQRQPIQTKSPFYTPIAGSHLVNDRAIVIYPEIVEGNPLKAKNVVRWFLHKPGFHTGVVKYAENDLFFSFDEHSSDARFKDSSKNILFIVDINENYKNDKQVKRFGSCYMIRKAKDAIISHDLQDSIRIDGMSHPEIAEIFKTRKQFYCYDEMTMYSQFAALCGCISIVMPSHFKNRDAWIAVHPISKFGIAYGVHDTEHAVNTQHKVIAYFAELEEQSLFSVKNFIQITTNYFFHDHQDK